MYDLDAITRDCEAAGARCRRAEVIGVPFLVVTTDALAVYVWPDSYTVGNDTIVQLGTPEMAVMDAITAGQRERRAA